MIFFQQIAGLGNNVTLGIVAGISMKVRLGVNTLLLMCRASFASCPPHPMLVSLCCTCLRRLWLNKRHPPAQLLMPHGWQAAAGHNCTHQTGEPAPILFCCRRSTARSTRTQP